jgi:hypothetical protein
VKAVKGSASRWLSSGESKVGKAENNDAPISASNAATLLPGEARFFFGALASLYSQAMLVMSLQEKTSVNTIGSEKEARTETYSPCA